MKYVPLSNGLWHLRKVNDFKDGSRVDEFRLCIADGGADVPFLVGRIPMLMTPDRDSTFRVTSKTSESVDARFMGSEIKMNLKIPSAEKMSADGMQSNAQERWPVHMDWDYQGTDCGGIWPGHMRANISGQWR